MARRVKGYGHLEVKVANEFRDMFHRKGVPNHFTVEKVEVWEDDPEVGAAEVRVWVKPKEGRTRILKLSPAWDWRDAEISMLEAFKRRWAKPYGNDKVPHRFSGMPRAGAKKKKAMKKSPKPKAADVDKEIVRALERMPTPIGLREPELAGATGLPENRIYPAVQRLKTRGTIVQTESKGWALRSVAERGKREAAARKKKATKKKATKKRTAPLRTVTPRAKRKPKARRHAAAADAAQAANCPYAVFEWVMEDGLQMGEDPYETQVDAIRVKELSKIPDSHVKPEWRDQFYKGSRIAYKPGELEELVLPKHVDEYERRISDVRILPIVIAKDYAKVVRAFRKAHKAGARLAKMKPAKRTAARMQAYEQAERDFRATARRFANYVVDEDERPEDNAELFELAVTCAQEVGLRTPAARSRRARETKAMREELMSAPMLPGMRTPAPKPPRPPRPKKRTTSKKRSKAKSPSSRTMAKTTRPTTPRRGSYRVVTLRKEGYAEARPETLTFADAEATALRMAERGTFAWVETLSGTFKPSAGTPTKPHRGKTYDWGKKPKAGGKRRAAKGPVAGLPKLERVMAKGKREDLAKSQERLQKAYEKATRAMLDLAKLSMDAVEKSKAFESYKRLDLFRDKAVKPDVSGITQAQINLAAKQYDRIASEFRELVDRRSKPKPKKKPSKRAARKRTKLRKTAKKAAKANCPPPTPRKCASMLGKRGAAARKRNAAKKKRAQRKAKPLSMEEQMRRAAKLLGS